jgi:outer membrane lipoprotein-sorting protein
MKLGMNLGMKRDMKSMKWMGAAAGVLVAGLSAAAQEDKPMQPMDQPATKQPATNPVDQPQPTDQPRPGEEKKGELSQENLPTAESLFEKHIAAIGGLEAIKSERNRLVRAKFTGPGGSSEGGLRVIRVAPNKMAHILEIPGVTTQEVWYNGEEGWKRDSNAGTKKVKGDELAEIKMQADIMGECNYKARYREVKTLAREVFAGVEAYSVKATPAEGAGREKTMFFDAKTGFLIGMKTKAAQGDSTVMMSEYKKFGETQHPTRSVMKVGDMEVGTITVSQIESNLSVPPTVEPPDEVKAVK